MNKKMYQEHVKTTYEGLVFEEAVSVVTKREGRVTLRQALLSLNREYAKSKELMVVLHGVGAGEYWDKKLQASADLLQKLEVVA